MRTAPAARETIAAAIIAFIAAIGLRLRAGDERGQAIDAAIVGRGRLRLRLILRLRTMFAVVAMFARLLITHVGLALARLLAVVAHIRLLLWLRREARLLAEAREILAVVFAFLAHHFVGARLLVLRLALAELFLGRCDQAEIMLGVLVVVLGGDRVAGGTRIAR